MGKHVKRGSPYGPTRGPVRWERAAANAYLRPNSKAGKQYLTRASNAHRLRTEYADSSAGPFAHPKMQWAGSARGYVTAGVSYYTCSLFCAAMVSQLDYGIEDYDRLLELMAEGGDRTPKREAPQRSIVRCQCCATDIKP